MGSSALKDFRGDLIRAFQAKGFIFHAKPVIWKDPDADAAHEGAQAAA